MNKFHVTQIITSTTGSFPFLGTVFLVSIFLKIFLLALLIAQRRGMVKLRKPLLYLCGILITSLLHDSSWIVYVAKFWAYPSLSVIFARTWARIAWGLHPIHCQLMTLFFESLVCSNHKIGLRQKLFSIPCFMLSLIFIFYLPIVYGFERSSYELLLQNAISIFTIFPSLISLIIAFYQLKQKKLPLILNNQLKLFVIAITIPWWTFEVLSLMPFRFTFFSVNNFTLTSLANIFLTIGFVYCARHIMGLRFLNSQDHVGASYSALAKTTFFINFKQSLKQLSTAISIGELHQITQIFFREIFSIPLEASSLHVCNTTAPDGDNKKDYASEATDFVENYTKSAPPAIISIMESSKIFMYDDICFTNFYEKTPENDAILAFMDHLNADIFLPIYDKNILMGYITITKGARKGVLYTDVDRDQMLIFASYLGNLINLIAHKNINTILQQYTGIKDQLHQSSQEILHYKESIRSCMGSQKQRTIGVIFYKSNRFVFGNKDAHDIIKINPNVLTNHYLTKDLKNVVQQVCAYKTPHRIFSKDSEGAPLVLSGTLQLETDSVLVTIFYPEASDIIRRQVDLLKDPSEWDYLLYLETTEVGKKINTIVPGTGKRLLAFKIEILKAAMSSRTVLLNVSEDDSTALAQFLHTISCREKLFTLKLIHPVKDKAIGTEIFGINHLFGKSGDGPPLLEKLRNKGTLFIQNIHFLDLETQAMIADFIEHGFFKPIHSTQRKESSVRIIASSSENLVEYIKEGSFSRDLYNALSITKVSLPSLTEFSTEEIANLVDGYCHAEKNKQPFGQPEHFLNTYDKKNLIHKRPLSLQKLRLKVHHILSKKSDALSGDNHRDNSILNNAENESFLLRVPKRGKHALRDKETVARLWKIFGSQVRIAEFLGVNRSSVNRRFKEYGFE